MKKLLLLTITLFITLIINAQETYVLLGSIPPSVYKLNPDTTLSFAFEINIPNSFQDIAISPSGTFYGISSENIYEIDTISSTATLIGQLPYPTSNPGLVCSNDYELYSINIDGKLSKYNILTDTAEFVFDVEHPTPGDLTFYKGNLIFQSLTDFNIKAFNLQNNSLVTIHCPMVDTTEFFLGLSNTFAECNEETILTFSSENNIYELDIANQTTIDMSFDDSGIYPNGFWGSATTTEHFGSNCSSFQFVNIDCTLSYNEVDINSNMIIFPNPTTSIITIKAENIESIEIMNIEGRKVYIGTENEIDLSQETKGIYIIKVTTNKGVAVEKVVLE